MPDTKPRQSHTPEQGHREVSRPRDADTPTWTYQEDEIDLVDLGVSLWARRVLIASVFLICLVAGTLFALVRGPSYRYSMSFTLGTYATSQGALTPFPSYQSALSAIQHAYLPKTLGDYARKHPGFDPDAVDVKISAQSGDSVVNIDARGSSATAAAIKAIEASVAKMMLNQTNEALSNMAANLKQTIAGLKKGLGPNSAQALASAQAQLASMRRGKVLYGPARSSKPVGMSRSVVIALSAVLGCVLALLAALLTGYASAVRQRLSTR